MKFRSFLFIALLLIAVHDRTAEALPPEGILLGVEIKSDLVLLPSQIFKSQPPVFSMGDHDPAQWVEKTDEWMAKNRPDNPTNWFIINYQDSTWRINWDAERRPFKGFVIHHSAGDSLLGVDSLSAIGRDRVYMPRYTAPWAESYGDPNVWDLPVHSGHQIVDQEETFATYHYYIYPSGVIVKNLATLIMLDDIWYVDMVAWHSGNWEVNCETLAICFMGDLTSQNPTKDQMASYARIYQAYEQQFPSMTVRPHCEINNKTTCPGNQWEDWIDPLKSKQ